MSRSGVGRVSGGVLLWLLVVGPWPAPENSSTQPTPVRDTPEPISAKIERSSPAPFRVGTAESTFVFSRPTPVAGFLDRISRPHEGTDEPCGVRAVTIATKEANVTIVAADLLLINGALRRLVLSRAGLTAQQVYFTATHSHSGPGGWGNHPLERLVAGTYDPNLAADLGETIAATVLRSRSTLQPAQVAFVQLECPNLQRNRILPGQPTNDQLSAWIFRSLPRERDPSRALATLAVFGAHATISHSQPPRLGGDYPAAFAEALRRLADPGMVLFAAGTVGDASPVRPVAPTQRQSVRAYGKGLAERLASQFATLRFNPLLNLASVDLEVRLPPIQVPFGSRSWRLSPLATWWIGSRQTSLRVLRLGPAYLAGFPGDIAGHLAQRLRASLPVVATSFNGDYKGYLLPRATFDSTACYETRAMSFYGPNLGEILVDRTQQSLDHLDQTANQPRQ